MAQESLPSSTLINSSSSSPTNQTTMESNNLLSLTSSPSHEFSFTISLSKPSPQIPEFDLAPADEIFFHGHLLPLHFLAHRPSDATIQNRVSESSQCKKAKSFPSFFSIPNWLKGKKKKKNKVLSGIWKRILLLKERRELRRSSCSVSAPASMRTSPANSGILVGPTSAFWSSDESSMDELQSAIQAAIAHCKNSVAVKEH